MTARVLALSGAELAAGVAEREYLRLLQLPRARPLEGELRERGEIARLWYAQHGRPFVAARRAGLRALGPGTVTLDTGDVLASDLLAERLRSGAAHALVALLATAGPEVADEAARLWAAERPDEAWFLDRFAAAAAERLVLHAAALVCREYEAAGETLLPHLSPGCGRWDLADQHRLMSLLGGSVADGGPEGTLSLGPVTLLPSGALHPQHSVLAAFGVTRRRGVAETPDDICRACELDPCAFRRAPFVAGALHAAGSR